MSLARRGIASALLSAWLCTTSAARAEPVLVLAGADAALVNGVAAELRLAGYTVRIASTQPDDTVTAVVSIEHVEEGIAVRAHLPDRLDGDVVAPAADDTGMSHDDHTSLRVAELVRSLIEMPPAVHEPAPEAPPPKSLESPLAKSPPSPTSAQPQAAWAPPSPSALPTPDSIPTSPSARIAVTAGVSYSQPYWWLVQSFAVRGQLLPTLSMGGSLGLMIPADFKTVDGYLMEPYGGTGRLFVEWEPLGAGGVWTPALGAGLRAEYVQYVGEPENGSGDIEVEDGQAFGLSPVLRLGASVLRPVRIRIDGELGLRVLGTDVVGRLGDNVLPTLVPSFGIMIGLGFDLGGREATATAATAATTAAWSPPVGTTSQF